jgi:hypothetical protein
MSTLLQLVNLARSEAGVAGGDLTTLANPVDETLRFKNWVVNEFYDLINERPDWEFMRKTFSFPTSTGVQSYSPATVLGGSISFADWKRDSFRISVTSLNYADEMILGFMPWETFRNLYIYGPNRTATARPVVFSVSPDKTLYLGLTPDATGYTVNGEYFQASGQVAITADSDVPPYLPVQYHNILAYRALRAYGIFSAAPEVIGRANSKLDVLHNALISNQLPQLMLGEPLA